MQESNSFLIFYKYIEFKIFSIVWDYQAYKDLKNYNITNKTISKGITKIRNLSNN